jgi:hypothetical protein
VVKLKTNNYQNLPWNNTIKEDTIRYSDSFYSQTHPIIIYFKDAKMFRCNYYTNMSGTCNNKYIRLIRISHGTTPLKKIPSVTQTSLLVGKGSMFGPLSRTPPQHPVHGPFDLVGYSCWLQKGPHNSSGALKCRSSTGLLENRNISINMGTEALVAD